MSCNCFLTLQKPLLQTFSVLLQSDGLVVVGKGVSVFHLLTPYFYHELQYRNNPNSSPGFYQFSQLPKGLMVDVWFMFESWVSFEISLPKTLKDKTFFYQNRIVPNRRVCL